MKTDAAEAASANTRLFLGLRLLPRAAAAELPA